MQPYSKLPLHYHSFFALHLSAYSTVANASEQKKPLTINHIKILLTSVNDSIDLFMKHRIALIWQKVTLDMLLLLHKPPTLLLWSLILMMGSFFLKSQTTAFPLGLAEARMCCTCLFQDTTLMSSAGWNGDKGCYCQKLTLVLIALVNLNNNTIRPLLCKQCFVHIQMTLQRKLLMVVIVITMFRQSQIVFGNFLWMFFLEHDHFI